MPIYEYQCDEGHEVEVIQSMSEDALTECPECGAPARRVLHSPAIHFKGSGFHNTDYGTRAANKAKQAAAAADSKESGGDSGSPGSDGSSSDSSSSGGASDSSSSGSKSAEKKSESKTAKAAPSSE
jgi:putative FmdB family regulatory protein